MTDMDLLTYVVAVLLALSSGAMAWIVKQIGEIREDNREEFKEVRDQIGKLSKNVAVVEADHQNTAELLKATNRHLEALGGQFAEYNKQLLRITTSGGKA